MYRESKSTKQKDEYKINLYHPQNIVQIVQQEGQKSWLERLSEESTSGFQLDKGDERIFSDEVNMQGAVGSVMLVLGIRRVQER